MKKVMFLMAVAGMFAFAACNNNNNAPEQIIDTPAIAEEMVEPCQNDSMPAEEAVEGMVEENNVAE